MCCETVSPYNLAPVGAVNTEKCRWGIRARMIYEGSRLCTPTTKTLSVRKKVQPLLQVIDDIYLYATCTGIANAILQYIDSTNRQEKASAQNDSPCLSIWPAYLIPIDRA